MRTSGPGRSKEGRALNTPQEPLRRNVAVEEALGVVIIIIIDGRVWEEKRKGENKANRKDVERFPIFIHSFSYRLFAVRRERNR